MDVLGTFLHFFYLFFVFTHGSQYINTICDFTSTIAFHLGDFPMCGDHSGVVFLLFFYFPCMSLLVFVTLHCCKEAQPHGFHIDRMSYVYYFFNNRIQQ